ncbi:MAG: hypothetical protein ABJH05_17150 [Fulvivirga sp.]
MQILYQNSFSRSGETLLLRCFEQHPRVKVLHQLLDLKDEHKLQYDIFKHIKSQKPSNINFSEEEKSILGIVNEDILLVKNATFEVRKPHYGFTLIRNPFSVYKSYMTLGNEVDIRLQMRRWINQIDKRLLFVLNETDLVHSFCAIYTRKMGVLININQPLIRYEDLVSDSKNALLKLCKHLNLTFHQELLFSHENYPKDKKGHGGIDLSAPIMNNDFNKLPELSEYEEHIIYSYTSNILKLCKYKIDFKNRTLTCN